MGTVVSLDAEMLYDIGDKADSLFKKFLLEYCHMEVDKYGAQCVGERQQWKGKEAWLPCC